jgi:tRNA threonylcarbamoyladenosine modification (KEOPS) complex  Pcc1 subunit
MNITIEVHTPDAEIVSTALRAEITSSPFTKSETTIHNTDSGVAISIHTEDIRALRGTFNSVMNWLMTALDSLSLE